LLWFFSLYDESRFIFMSASFPDRIFLRHSPVFTIVEPTESALRVHGSSFHDTVTQFHFPFTITSTDGFQEQSRLIQDHSSDCSMNVAAKLA